MLALLNISNFALASDLRVEFERGLNLLTGETGSGKSIIVDALGVLIGGRFSTDLIRSGEEHASVEGLFQVGAHAQVAALLEGAGLDVRAGGDEAVELVIRRELTSGGRGKVFVNNRLSTLALLRELRPYLVDIHGQGDQQTLFEVETHLELLDAFAGLAARRQEVAALYRAWSSLRRELDELRRDESEKLNLIDGLRFQVGELEAAGLAAGEDERLEEERRRLNNLEKVSALCADAYDRTYEDNDSTVARLSLLERQIAELSNYESNYRNYADGISTARAVLEDLAHTLRGFAESLTFSPARLAEVEDRLAEIARLKRKYGGTIDAALEHLARSRERLQTLEHADVRAEEIAKELRRARDVFLDAALRLHRERAKAAKDFRRGVEQSLGEVAMEHAQFEARIESSTEAELRASESSKDLTASGIDRVEFFFSANPGEPARPLSKVASGGEASRLMLVLKTIAGPARFPRTIVFDEVDAGIGGRVSEAVGLKLKALARTNQVLCVTHQAQIARFADSHLRVTKAATRGRTEVGVEKLDRPRRVEELARMLTGSEITDTARRHAREMLKTA
jgi:DNA repair protein RecN (Recombination protein N)